MGRPGRHALSSLYPYPYLLGFSTFNNSGGRNCIDIDTDIFIYMLIYII